MSAGYASREIANQKTRREKRRERLAASFEKSGKLTTIITPGMLFKRMQESHRARLRGAT